MRESPKVRMRRVEGAGAGAGGGALVQELGVGLAEGGRLDGRFDGTGRARVDGSAAGGMAVVSRFI